MQELNKIMSRVQSLFSWGKTTIVENDGLVQNMQLSLHSRQTRNDIQAPQQYGMESAPHVGADALVLFKAGAIENGAVITAYEPKFKPTDIEEGDVELYTSRGISPDSSNSKAKGTVIFTGIDGTIIPPGVMVNRIPDDFRFIVTELCMIVGGFAWARVEALGIEGDVNLGKGDDGNTAQGTVGYINDDTPVIGALPAVAFNNVSVTKQRLWIKESDGRILIETDQDVQIIANTADINTTGATTITSQSSVDINSAIDVNVISALNITATTTNLTATVATLSTITCPQTLWTGNITLTGDITQTGKITSSGDHLAGTISLQGHVHPGDGGTGSGPDTGAPIA